MSFKIKYAVLVVALVSIAVVSAPAFSADAMLGTGGYAREFQKMGMMKMLDADGNHMVTQAEADSYYNSIFDELDKYPVVHLVWNQKDVTEAVLCNCHWDCCAPMQATFSNTDRYEVTVQIEKSRFEAVVDPGKCIGCKTCIIACPFGAPSFDHVDRVTIKCDYCSGEPQCARFCDVHAIRYADVSEVSNTKKYVAAEKFISALRKSSGA